MCNFNRWQFIRIFDLKRLSCHIFCQSLRSCCVHVCGNVHFSLLLALFFSLSYILKQFEVKFWTLWLTRNARECRIFRILLLFSMICLQHCVLLDGGNVSSNFGENISKNMHSTKSLLFYSTRCCFCCSK